MISEYSLIYHGRETLFSISLFRVVSWRYCFKGTVASCVNQEAFVSTYSICCLNNLNISLVLEIALIYIFLSLKYALESLGVSYTSRDCPARFVWLKVVSFDRSLLKGKAPRLSADFNHPLSYERPFKFLRHLVGSLEINNKIAMSAINIHSAIFKF
jgi:hypothetical protein